MAPRQLFGNLCAGKTEQTSDCGSASVIGSNSGVYVGGLPQDFVIHRQDGDRRLQVMHLDEFTVFSCLVMNTIRRDTTVMRLVCSIASV